jgi:hypothetical protein
VDCKKSIDRLEKNADIQNLYKCYSELCQYTHPAAESVSHLCLQSKIDYSFVLAPRPDQILIENFVKKYNSVIVELIDKVFSSSIVLMKILSYIDVYRRLIKALNTQGI